MSFLTDRTLATAVTLNDLIHIVITGDTSQNPAGSSYKATISQVTDLVNSVIVTGGTYNSTTGEITFFNSSGGTFVVSGFVTGFTDTYVTGGTYSAGTAVFTNTTGGTFSVSGFTDPFTGGSGNCITDFYVTNIYGCSPITIFDSIQSSGSTVSGQGSFAFGLSVTASTDGSFSHGQQNIALGINSHSEGYKSLAIGNFSHVEGGTGVFSGGTSIGLGSHAEGVQTQSVGDYSHAEGYSSQSIGKGSHAEGNNTISIGQSSHSEGEDTIAIGDSSNTKGLGTIAVGSHSLTCGSYNFTSSTQSAFIIGNGTSDLNRSNLVFAAGNDFNIYGDLNVTGVINGNISGLTEFILTTGVTTSAFTITTGTTYWGINYNGNVDVSIPDPTGIDGLKLIIKDEGGYSGSYRIRLTPLVGTIDGNSYVDMNINYMSLTLVARNNNWWLI